MTELDRAVLAYLLQNGCEKSFQSICNELKINCTREELQPYEGALQNRWNCIGRLQKRIMELETESRKRTEFFSTLFGQLDPNTFTSCDLNHTLMERLLQDDYALELSARLENNFGSICRFSVHQQAPYLLLHYADSNSRIVNVLEKIAGRETGHSNNLLFIGHSLPVSASCFSDSIEPDGQLLFATGSSDTTICIYSLNAGQSCKCLRTIFSHSGSLSFLAFCHNNSLLSHSRQENTLKLHSTITGQQLVSVAEIPDFCCIAARPDSQQDASHFVGITSENDFYALCIKTLITVKMLHLECPEGARHQKQITQCLWFSPTLFVTGANDRSIKLWKITPPKHFSSDESWPVMYLMTLDGHVGWITGLYKVLDDFLLSVSDNQQILLWNLKNLGKNEQPKAIKVELVRNGQSKEKLKISSVSVWIQFVIVLYNDSSMEIFSLF